MKLADVLDVLRGIAPEALAEPWDKVGLQVGDPTRRVRRGLLCIDLTPAVLTEAVRLRAEMVVAYHPPIFDPLARLTTGDWKQATILRAIERRIAIYSPHTALDAAEGGVNDWLADGIGAGERRPIRPTKPPSDFKIVTFVPPGHADTVRRAMSDAGAGRIGDYTECSFNLVGEGTFRAGPNTNPTIGKPGSFERVREVRIEMICAANFLAASIAALRRSHPYEEAAFDIHPMQPDPTHTSTTGQGRVVTLDKAIAHGELVRRLKRHLKVRHLEVALPARTRPIRRIGLSAGAGGSLLGEAGDIDVFVTGEMRHHDVLAARERGVAVVLAGHTQTERPYLPVYRHRLAKATGRAVAWQVSRADAAVTRVV